MAAAGTDLSGHQRFLDQAEAYRYAIVQRLNQMQADAVSYADDIATDDDRAADRRRRVSAENWQSIPDFEFQPAEPHALASAAMPGLMMLAVWLAAALALLAPASSHLRRGIQ